jgi:16S rRNA (uracil1498-N3)-methyltransferase
LGAVVKVGKRETIAEVGEELLAPAEPFELILGLALIRAAAFELALEKVVEIGVTRIVPVIAARSNAPAPRKTERLTRIIVEAAKQSKRRYLPVLEPTAAFEDVLQRDAASKILFAEREGGPLHSALGSAPVLYLIGPEGGWTDAELSLAREHGFALVSLGTTILKAETAAIVGAALFRHELADDGQRCL